LTSSRPLKRGGIPTLTSEYFLLRWRLPVRAFAAPGLTFPPQAFAFRLPIGSFSILQVRKLGFRFLIRDMVFVPGKKERGTLVQHGSVFTPDPSSGNPYTIQFSMCYLYILIGCEETGSPGAQTPKQGPALSSTSPKGRWVFPGRSDKIVPPPKPRTFETRQYMRETWVISSLLNGAEEMR